MQNKVLHCRGVLAANGKANISEVLLSRNTPDVSAKKILLEN